MNVKKEMHELIKTVMYDESVYLYAIIGYTIMVTVHNIRAYLG